MVGAFAAVTGPMWALHVSAGHASSQAWPGSCVTICRPSLGAATSPPGPGPSASESLCSASGSWPHHSPVSAEASRNQADGEGFRARVCHPLCGWVASGEATVLWRSCHCISL